MSPRCFYREEVSSASRNGIVVRDATCDFFDPPWEQTKIVLIELATLRKAQHMIGRCEACSGTAEIPFDWILDKLTGSNRKVTD
jgi:hypothetical protein